ncbi:acyl-CoA thioesterase [Rothia koreensis]|uniref:acyl-CoA thioesterase n=1 Tax=Rothia koreensis TaxID=592378 RepID=UPI003FCECFC1
MSTFQDSQFPSENDDPTDSLVRMLDVEPSTPLRTTEDIFVGHTLAPETPRVFGGQVFAQSAMAASRTVDDDRPIHSMHGCFLRPGDVTQPIVFGVERMRDGRSFSARRIHAYQEGQVILSSIASFQTPAEGLEHHEPMPDDVPDPDTLPSPEQLWGHVDHPLAQRVVHGRPFEIRYVTEPIYLKPSESREPVNAVWFRTHRKLPDDPVVHRAAIAYASDYTPMDPILRRHGMAWIDPHLTMASLDHAIWWHRDARADDWLLYTQASPNASSSRGLACGRIFDRHGALVATTIQEAMVRVRPGADRT